MNKMVTSTQQFLMAIRFYVEGRIKSDRGATAVEYGLLVALIAVVIIAAVALLGTNLSGLFGKVSSDIN